MRSKIISYIGAGALLFTALSHTVEAQSRELFDTETATKTLSLGVRVSATSSNVSPNYDDMFTDVSSIEGDWGYGFNVGVVANLNIKKYFSIQPGLFFSNRSYDTNITTISSVTNYFSYVEKHSRFYCLQIPVMASFKMNLTKGVEVLMEAGPYLAFGLGGNTRVMQTSNSATADGGLIDSERYKYSYFGKGTMKNIQMKKGDWGVKIGAGFKFAHRASLAIYYLAGCENIAQENQGYESKVSARNKEWNLTLGYDF